MPFLHLHGDKTYRIFCALESNSYYRYLEQNVKVETIGTVYAKRRHERVYTGKKL